jgi:hypothetical protein
LEAPAPAPAPAPESPRSPLAEFYEKKERINLKQISLQPRLKPNYAENILDLHAVARTYLDISSLPGPALSLNFATFFALYLASAEDAG